ncbi:MAG: hypothetical protein GY906_40265, partial [bacterium]|nr:hypothetical protein [bacterium]
MKRTGVVVLVLISLSSILAHSAEITADDLVNKIIDARGGRAALQSVKDSTILGSIELVQMGAEGALTDYWKQPAKRRADFDIFGMTVTQAFDGAHAWMNNPQAGGIQDLPADRREAFARNALGHS